VTWREEQIGDARLILGDCREILPAIDPVDAVITDPPYLLTTGGDTDSHKALGGWIGANKNDGRPVHCDVTWDEIMRLLYGALKADGDAYVMANDKNVTPATNAALDAGFGFHNLLVWDKRTAVMNRWYMKNCEFAVYLWKGSAKTIRDPSSKQLCSVPNLNDCHPTSKPVELMAHYIGNSSDFGDTVLDPFMGVGTTGVAAGDLGRKFIGIEIEPKYFDIACKRIDEAYKQGDMFIERPKLAKQESFEILATPDKRVG
jgi:site-specific DNA-methyltransferase (adenine-specific)